MSRTRFTNKPALILFSIFMIALLPIGSSAMWARMTDAELIKQSNLIVKATYIGSTTISVDKKKLHLGVLHIEDTLKGNQQGVVFIRLGSTTKGFPKKSDEISFKLNQKGMWFLEKNIEQEGVYIINRPDRFIPEEQFKNRLPALFKLLH